MPTFTVKKNPPFLALASTSIMKCKEMLGKTATMHDLSVAKIAVAVLLKIPI